MYPWYCLGLGLEGYCLGSVLGLALTLLVPSLFIIALTSIAAEKQQQTNVLDATTDKQTLTLASSPRFGE